MEHKYLTKVGAYSWYIYGTAAKAATVGVCTHKVLEIYIDWIIGVTQGSGLISSSAYPAPPQSNAFPSYWWAGLHISLLRSQLLLLSIILLGWS